MRSWTSHRGTVAGLVVAAVFALVASGAALAQGGLQVAQGTLTLAPPQPIGPCGQEYHNFPRELKMTWSADPGAKGYQVEVECLHCAVVGQWSSVTPGGTPLNVAGTSATLTFPGDNQGQWRVRAMLAGQGQSPPARPQPAQPGPWSAWCTFSFKTGQAPQGGHGQPCGINLTSLSKTKGFPGEDFYMIGTWGPAQGTKLPCINKGGMNKLEVIPPWNSTKLHVRVPMDLAPGTYKVGVYCEALEGGGTVYSSGWLDFEVLKPRPMPDITSKKGIIIGGDVGGAGGKFVPWGGSVTLTEKDALHGSPNNECAFNLSYDMLNLTANPTSPAFLNRIKVDAPAGMKVVSIQSALSLAGSETKQVNTQAYLPIGKHALSLWLDDDHNVAEVPPNGESNNVFRIVYELQGKCYQPYNPR